MSPDIGQLYETYGPAVLRRCRSLLKDEEQARDAMHDVFVKLVLLETDLDSARVGGLLYCMATQVSLNLIRRTSRRPETRDEALLMKIAGVDDPEERSAARALLAKLFGQTQASTKAIAVMHLLDGMTLKEVADEVGMSVSGVRKRLRKLKVQLNELEGL